MPSACLATQVPQHGACQQEPHSNLHWAVWFHEVGELDAVPYPVSLIGVQERTAAAQDLNW